MQLLSSGVRVMVAYPPDTDTPGYAKENLSKVQPLQCNQRNLEKQEHGLPLVPVARCIQHGLKLLVVPCSRKCAMTSAEQLAMCCSHLSRWANSQ